MSDKGLELLEQLKSNPQGLLDLLATVVPEDQQSAELLRRSVVAPLSAFLNEDPNLHQSLDAGAEMLSANSSDMFADPARARNFVMSSLFTTFVDGVNEQIVLQNEQAAAEERRLKRKIKSDPFEEIPNERRIRSIKREPHEMNERNAHAMAEDPDLSHSSLPGDNGDTHDGEVTVVDVVYKEREEEDEEEEEEDEDEEEFEDEEVSSDDEEEVEKDTNGVQFAQHKEDEEEREITEGEIAAMEAAPEATVEQHQHEDAIVAIEQGEIAGSPEQQMQPQHPYGRSQTARRGGGGGRGRRGRPPRTLTGDRLAGDASGPISPMKRGYETPMKMGQPSEVLPARNSTNCLVDNRGSRNVLQRTIRRYEEQYQEALVLDESLYEEEHVVHHGGEDEHNYTIPFLDSQ